MNHLSNIDLAQCTLHGHRRAGNCDSSNIIQSRGGQVWQKLDAHHPLCTSHRFPGKSAHWRTPWRFHLVDYSCQDKPCANSTFVRPADHAVTANKAQATAPFTCRNTAPKVCHPHLGLLGLSSSPLALLIQGHRFSHTISCTCPRYVSSSKSTLTFLSPNVLSSSINSMVTVARTWPPSPSTLKTARYISGRAAPTCRFGGSCSHFSGTGLAENATVFQSIISMYLLMLPFLVRFFTNGYLLVMLLTRDHAKKR